MDGGIERGDERFVVRQSTDSVAQALTFPPGKRLDQRYFNAIQRTGWFVLVTKVLKQANHGVRFQVVRGFLANTFKLLLAYQSFKRSRFEMITEAVKWF